jgi:hypothetical protein
MDVDGEKIILVRLEARNGKKVQEHVIVNTPALSCLDT